MEKVFKIYNDMYADMKVNGRKNTKMFVDKLNEELEKAIKKYGEKEVRKQYQSYVKEYWG